MPPLRPPLALAATCDSGPPSWLAPPWSTTAGQLGTQTVRVWLEADSRGVSVLSHDIGPALESWFGKDDIETSLTVRNDHLPNLATVLGCGSSRNDVTQAIAVRYRGESAATTYLRSLDEKGIPYEFDIV